MLLLSIFSFGFIRFESVQFSGRLPLQHAMEARVQICILAQEMGNLMWEVS